MNSQSGKGGVAYIMKTDHQLDLPRRLQIEFSHVIQRHTDGEGGEVDAAQMWQIFDDEYLAPGAFELVKFSLEQRRGHRADHRDGARVRRRAQPHRRRQRPDRGVLRGAVRRRPRLGGLHVRVLDYAEHALTAGRDAEAAAYLEIEIGDEVCGASDQRVDRAGVAARRDQRGEPRRPRPLTGQFGQPCRPRGRKLPRSASTPRKIADAARAQEGSMTQPDDPFQKQPPPQATRRRRRSRAAIRHRRRKVAAPAPPPPQGGGFPPAPQGGYRTAGRLPGSGRLPPQGYAAAPAPRRATGRQRRLRTLPPGTAARISGQADRHVPARDRAIRRHAWPSGTSSGP